MCETAKDVLTRLRNGYPTQISWDDRDECALCKMSRNSKDMDSAPQRNEKED